MAVVKNILFCEKNEPDEIIQRIYNNIVVNVQWSACHNPTKEQSAIFSTRMFLNTLIHRPKNFMLSNYYYLYTRTLFAL